MSQINRVPKGFLSLLEAKTQGRTPATVVPQLSPTIDLSQFYLNDVQLQLRGTSDTTVDSIGDYGSVQVPDGEAWLVYSISCICTLLSSAWTVNASAAIEIPSGLGRMYFSNPGFIPTLNIVGQELSRSKYFDTPLFLSSGATMFLRNHAAIGFSQRVDTSVIYKKLDV